MNKYQKSCSRSAKRFNGTLGYSYRKHKNYLYNNSKKNKYDIKKVNEMNVDTTDFLIAIRNWLNKVEEVS